jgi:hypothetical protein
MLVRDLVRSARVLIVGVGILAAFALSPAIARGLDGHGMPGGGLVFFGLVALALLLAFQVRTLRSSGHRAREMAKAARELGLTYPPAFRLPAGLERLASAAQGYPEERHLMNAAAGHVNGRAIIVFDQLYRSDSEGRVHSRTWAATETDIDAATVIVEPRAFELTGWTDGLNDVALELDAFDRRFRVRTDDVRFAVAFLDQRTMAWFLSEPGTRTYVTSGTWIACMEPGMPIEDLPAMIAAAQDLASRIPQVVKGLYPSPNQIRWTPPGTSTG